MQAASDIFLGWTHVDRGLDGVERDFYVRQLRDWKGSADDRDDERRPAWSSTAASALDARAGPRPLRRPRSRSPPTWAAATPSTGRSPTFSEAYADQNERDYAALVDAVKSGQIKAQTGL